MKDWAGAAKQAAEAARDANARAAAAEERAREAKPETHKPLIKYGRTPKKSIEKPEAATIVGTNAKVKPSRF